MLTDQDISDRLATHAKLIEERKFWFMPPLPLDELEMRLRIEQLKGELDTQYVRTNRI